MKIKPTGNALRAYELGYRNRREGKRREENPYIIFGSADDMKASWWITGWQESDKESRK